MRAKAFLKTSASALLHHSGLRSSIAAAERVVAGGRRVAIFGYHRVTDDFERERVRGIESCLVSKETFRKHVEWLASRFELVTMSRAVEVLGRRVSVKRDVAAITFDDGYADVLENALPVLRELKAPATLYVSSGVVTRAGSFPHDRLYRLLKLHARSETVRQRTPPKASRTLEDFARQGMVDPKRILHDLIRDRSPRELETLIDQLSEAAGRLDSAVPASMKALDWDGVRALADAGLEIGAHTVEHTVLTNMPSDEVERELRLSKAVIEREIQRPVRHFAYCNGYFNASVIRSLQRAGYLSAVTTEDRVNRLGTSPFRLARRVVWEGTARGPFGTSEALLACQLDGTFRALGLDSSESGERPLLAVLASLSRKSA